MPVGSCQCQVGNPSFLFWEFAVDFPIFLLVQPSSPRENLVMNTRVETCSGSSYRDLIAWKRAVEFVTEVYRTTKSFPDDERFGLIAQLRRAAVSVASNIAEGQGRFSRREFKQFLGQARGSLLEIETQITIARNLGYLDASQNDSILRRSSELGKILNGLIGSLGIPRSEN